MTDALRAHDRLVAGGLSAEQARTGTVKLVRARIEKQRRSSALRPHAAALALVTSAQIAKACARTARYSVAGRSSR